MTYIITDKCQKTGDCIDGCPSGSITMGETKAVIDPDTCTDCGDCAEVCPNAAPIPAE